MTANATHFKPAVRPKSLNASPERPRTIRYLPFEEFLQHDFGEKHVE